MTTTNTHRLQCPVCNGRYAPRTNRKGEPVLRGHTRSMTMRGKQRLVFCTGSGQPENAGPAAQQKER